MFIIYIINSHIFSFNLLAFNKLGQQVPNLMNLKKEAPIPSDCVAFTSPFKKIFKAIGLSLSKNTDIESLVDLKTLSLCKCKRKSWISESMVLLHASNSFLIFFEADNFFTGTIPSEFSKLSSLESLNLGKAISLLIQIFPALSFFWLYYISVAANNLTGPVPPDLQKLTNLKVLNLRMYRSKMIFKSFIAPHYSLKLNSLLYTHFHFRCKWIDKLYSNWNWEAHPIGNYWFMWVVCAKVPNFFAIDWPISWQNLHDWIFYSQCRWEWIDWNNSGWNCPVFQTQWTGSR